MEVEVDIEGIGSSSSSSKNSGSDAKSINASSTVVAMEVCTENDGNSCG